VLIFLIFGGFEMAQKNLTTEQKKRDLWMLENVDKTTRRLIKQYAFENEVTIAEALRQIVVLARERLENRSK